MQTSHCKCVLSCINNYNESDRAQHVYTCLSYYWHTKFSESTFWKNSSLLFETFKLNAHACMHAYSIHLKATGFPVLTK